MITESYDLILLETLSEQQRELVNVLECVCETVDGCTCERKLMPETLDTLRTQLTFMRQELARGQELTAELTQQVVEETSIVEIDCEEFEYWSR